MKTPVILLLATRQFCLFYFTWYRIIAFLLFAIMLIPNRSLAQIKLWDKIYGGNSYDEFKSAKKTTDGGYILGGLSDSNKSSDKSQDSRGQGDYWIIKFKADNSKEWDKTFGGTQGDQFIALQQTNDGGYLLGGSSNSQKSGDKTAASRGGLDYWILKLDAKGNKEWDKTLGGSNTDLLTSLQQTNDGGYILGGYSYSGKSGDKSAANKRPRDDNGNEQADYWVIKLDSTGKKVWDKTIGGEGNDELITLQQTKDGGYLLGGNSNSGIFADKSEPRKSDCMNGDYQFCYDYWVVKINATGIKQWDKTLGGNADDKLATITTMPDGSYLLGGTSQSDESGDKSEPNRDNTEDLVVRGDYWLIKIQADGTKLWDKTFGGNKKDELSSVYVTPEGGLLLGGHTNSNKSTDMSEVREEVASIWMIKTDAKGNKLWDKIFSNINRDVRDLSLAIMLTPDGNCLVASQTYIGATGWEKSQAGKGSTDFWLVKFTIPDKKVQTITFPLSDQSLSNAPFTFSAKASSGLPVTYKLISGPATRKGNHLSFTGYGTIIVKAFQSGNATYSPVEYTTSFRVQRLPTKEDKTIGGDGADMLGDMVATPDGGYLLAGTSSSKKSGDKSTAIKGASDYWLVKIDKNKKKAWDKSYGGSGMQTLSTIISTSDGGYLLGGTSDSGKQGDKSEDSKGKNDYWIVKVDEDGNKLWDKTIGGSLDDNLSAIVATNDGGFLLGGTSESSKSGDKSEENKGKPNANGQISSDFWVVKINDTGKTVWDKTWGNPNQDKLKAIIATPDGNYLLGGHSELGDEMDLYVEFWVLKINPQGKQLWSKVYNPNWYSDLLTTMTVTPDGGYLLVGTSAFETSHFTVVRTDAAGNELWNKAYEGGGFAPCYMCHETNFSTPFAILATPMGHFLIGGYSHSDKGNDRSEENRGYNDYWLLEIDENGQKVADKSYGSTKSDMLTTMVASPDGGYLLGGSSNSNADWEKSEDSKGDYDFWLLETQISAFPPPTLEAWNLRYGGNDLDNFTTVIQTPDGGYLLGGYSYSNDTGDKTQNRLGKSDYWLVKTDPSGSKLWDKRYGGSGRDYLNSIVPTFDGGFLLGGNSDSGISGDKTSGAKGGKDMWVVKINSSGEIEWEQSYGGSGDEDLRKVKKINNYRYLLVGYSNSPVSGDKTQASRGGQDYWIASISSDGYLIWDKRYGGTENDYLEDALVLDNEELLLGGTSFSAATGDKSQASQGSSDYWLMRTNNQGDKLWDKRYGGNGPDQLYSLLSTHSDTLLLAGHSASGKSGEKSQNSQGDKDYWLVQVNSKGEQQWNKTYGGSGEENLRAIIQDKEGGYLLGGTSFSGQSGDKSQTSQGSSDYWIVKTNTKGIKLWDKRYGGNNEEELRSIYQTGDGGYLLSGRSNSGISGDRTQPSQGSTDFWLVKVAPSISTFLVTEREASNNTGPMKAADLNSLTVYPNPFSELLTVSFTLLQTQLATVKVYDTYSREITTLFRGKAEAKQTYQITWQAHNQSSGMYFLQLQTPTKQIIHKVLLSK